MKIWGYMLTGALMAAPMLAGAVTIGPGNESGTGEAGVMPTNGTRIVVPFDVMSDFDAVLGVSISGDASGDLGEFSTALSSLQFGLSTNEFADVSMTFAPTDFTIPASAAFKFAEQDLFNGETLYLIYELPADFAFGAEELTLSYAYASELRPVSPVAPIPLPATALLLLGGLGGLTLLGRKTRA